MVFPFHRDDRWQGQSEGRGMNHDVKIWKDRCDRLWEFIELYAAGFITEATDDWNGPEEEEE